MNIKFLKKGILIITLVMGVAVPVQRIVAVEEIKSVTINKKEVTDKNFLINVASKIQKQNNKDTELKILSKEELQLHNKLLDKIFITTTDGVAFVYAQPTEESDWVGKVFDSSIIKIAEHGDEWSLVESGNVIGYVKTENLIVGTKATEKAKAILNETYQDKDLHTLTYEEIEKAFSLGETKEEEAARVAKEEAERIATKEANRTQKQEQLVKYAKRFIGNPYVYGGTSLTKGTDCSGFVQGVYRKFGVELPRTSYAMRKVGHKVRVRDIQLGDIVCYRGHVGIYAGNGKIVNAINEDKGIGMSNLHSNTIITVRRIF